MVQIDKPADGESGEIQIHDGKQLKAIVKAIVKAIQEAEKYASGKRSQKLLNFDRAKEALQATANQGALSFGG